ncbi:hypothetical protein [Nocardioides sp.]|uniref:hypothetical protein n=1 Tax=Nocardioides sp. TaxID=35761 RepID=UPI002ED43D21
MRCGGTLLVLTALLAVGCSADQPSERDDGPPPEVSISVTQLLPDEGTSKALLRVTNESDSPLRITGTGLDWSGYGERFVRPQDDELAAGQTLDLRTLLPDEVCDAADEPVVAVLKTDRGPVSQPLTASGEVYLRRLWEKRCFEQTLADQVSISYAPGWVIDEQRESLDGDLLLRRQGGDLTVAVTGAAGSVLHDLAVRRPTESTPDQPVTRVPLSITPGNRCDEHAIGQATAPFTFQIVVSIEGGPDQVVLVVPPVPIQKQASALLTLHCDRRG